MSTPQHTPADAPRVVNEGGEKFRARVMNPAMFRAYMLVKMPTLGVTGATLTRLDLERCEAVLPWGWTVKNLFGSMATAALLGVSEIVSASLWMINIRNEGAGVLPRLDRAEIALSRAVDGPVHFRCLEGHRYGEAIAQAQAQGGASLQARVEGVGPDGEVLCEVTLHWALAPK